MSSDLTWLIIRDNSSFLVKRNGLQFSKEAGNLKNLNSFKYSGIANNKVVGVSASADKKAINLTTKKSSALKNKPSKQVATQKLGRDFRRTAKTIKNVVSGYRADLTAAALARLTAIKQAAKPKKVVAKKVRGNRK